ncbi:MAG: hypothetical protein HFI85_04700 [Clostridia bacterium]|jgi:hypothetical protein|nr:hypothetical protein [Clostridia bacterium]
MTDNIVLKCYYYKPKEKYNLEKQSREIRKRIFVSCNGGYNYVSYVDTGAANKLPKDYAEYVGNTEKSCGVFNKEGLLDNKQKRDLRNQLRETQSCIWDMVISFREDFGNEYCRDYEQAYKFLVKELPKFFKRAGLDKDNIVWYAGLHENTENKHIHISFFEKEPKFYANGGKLRFHSGKIDKDVLLTSKVIFERALTNKSAEIVKARKDLSEKYKIGLSHYEMTRTLKKKLLELYREIPANGRTSYDSENMEFLKKKVDDTTECVLYANPKTKESYLNYKLKINEYREWQQEQYKHIPDKYNTDIYQADLMRRLGNITIQTALKLGKLNDEIERLQNYNRKEKAFKKQQRTKQLDYLLDLFEYYANCEEREMLNFKYWCEERERYAKHQEYLNGRNRDFEM